MTSKNEIDPLVSIEKELATPCYGCNGSGEHNYGFMGNKEPCWDCGRSGLERDYGREKNY